MKSSISFGDGKKTDKAVKDLSDALNFISLVSEDGLMKGEGKLDIYNNAALRKDLIGVIESYNWNCHS
ncbi:MAG: hypothetical protein LBU32_05495 [Clostridiales bacterium]|nr:hypothetical protein [Clostridiales bacterium]